MEKAKTECSWQLQRKLERTRDPYECARLCLEEGC